jgi:integrase
MQKPVKLWLRTNRDKTQSTYTLEFWEDGKRRTQSLGHADPKKAERQRIDKRIELSGTAAMMRPRMSLIELGQTYLAATMRLETSTRALTAYLFGLLATAVGEMPIERFGPPDAERFQTWLVKHGRAPITANNYIKTVRPAFRWAMRNRLIDSDPFLGLAAFRCQSCPIRVLEPGEFEALLNACPDQLWRARLLLAKTAGLRRGEVMNLTRADVDLRRSILWVQGKPDSANTWRWAVKDKERRELPIIPMLETLMREIAASLPSDDPYLMLDAERYAYVRELKAARKMPDRFRTVPDHGFDPGFRAIAERAGVNDASFHDLRRTCITEWLESGMMPHEVMALAGHADLETTMRYYVATRRTMIDRARTASALKLTQKIV